jgi:hypothetical protein
MAVPITLRWGRLSVLVTNRAVGWLIFAPAYAGRVERTVRRRGIQIQSALVCRGGEVNQLASAEDYVRKINSFHIFLDLPSLSNLYVSKLYEIMARKAKISMERIRPQGTSAEKRVSLPNLCRKCVLYIAAQSLVSL